jgi:hypothetical protein
VVEDRCLRRSIATQPSEGVSEQKSSKLWVAKFIRHDLVEIECFITFILSAAANRSAVVRKFVDPVEPAPDQQELAWVFVVQFDDDLTAVQRPGQGQEVWPGLGVS